MEDSELEKQGLLHEISSVKERVDLIFTTYTESVFNNLPPGAQARWKALQDKYSRLKVDFAPTGEHLQSLKDFEKELEDFMIKAEKE